jgi:hypothetical protein
MCKNSGKTTTLGRVIEDFSGASGTVALTSIGRDGEATDLATGTKKPGIYVREGSLIATAEGLLRNCDVTKEILASTGIVTPLGEVIVARALSDGNVQLAGPSMVAQLAKISRTFRELGATRVVIDGAVGRKTFCSRSLTEATVLCAGASCGRNMDAVVAETAHVCRLLATPEVKDASLENMPARGGGNGKYLLLGDETSILPDGSDLISALRRTVSPRLLYVEGAVTDGILNPLMSLKLPEGFTVVARDAGRLLLSADALRKLSARKWRLGVLEGVNLAAVTVNPYSVYGYDFDEHEFLRRMKAASPVPVFNVRDSGGRAL